MSQQSVDTAIQIAIQHHQAGRLAEAQAAYREILARDPAHADTLHLLGVLMHQSGQNSDQALGFVRRAIALNPNVPEYHCNLGLIFSDQRRWPEAIGAFQQALALRPEYGTVLNYLGTALRETGRLEDAAASYQRAVAVKPDFFVAYSNLGNVLRELNRLQESADACRRAIALKPDFAPAHNNLGNAMNKQDRLDDAVAAYRQALAINPQYAEARSNLGNALKDLGHLDEAIAAYREALALNPNLPECHSNLLYDLHYRDDFNPLAVLEESRAWATRYAQPLAAQIRAHGNDRDPDRRLRIGYISADFRQHAVSSFLLPLLKHHDHRQFEIFSYSNTRAPDHVTALLRQCADQWRDIVAKPDDRAAEIIRQDGIDILLDLAGHTAQHRLLLLARKPAPIQMTWLGYPGTTGLAAIDYRLSDSVADPPGLTESHYSETLLRLPRTNWCFSPIVDAPPVQELPALSSRDQRICFGCFNNFAKITDGMFETWARLLLAVPNSRLLIKAKALGVESVRQGVVQRLAELGVASERLDLRGRLLNPADHLATYGQVDIALDTFPYHGTTTTCEALWMGVPVVTLAGAAHVSRVGASLLTSVGLPELIAHTSNEYVEIAARLAGDLSKLSEIRAGLREKISAPPLGDGPSFARDFEAACRGAWKKWCAANPGPIQKPPETLEEAAERCRRAIASRPGDAEAHFDLGKALHFLGLPDEAIACFERTLALIPEKPEAIANIGASLQARGQVDEAIAMFRRAVALKPSLAEARYNLGLALLLEGQFAEGWKQHKYRLALPEALAAPLPFRVPRWDGRELAGRTILIHAEQGFGDTIQFLRYIPEVIRRGGRVLLVVRKEFERLLRGENGQGAGVVSRLVLGSRRIDTHIQLMSLPLVLGMYEPLVMKQPYVRADSTEQAKWAEILAGSPRPRVGLVWAGNPQHKGDRQRSLPLAALAPLGKANATFYSLQIGPAARQAGAAPFPLIDPTAGIGDLSDTAGLIAGLDLVITVDTAVAHLAGAMGKPTWVLLPFAPDWRWMRDRCDSAWYPSVRVFRQVNAGDWEVPIARAAAELIAFGRPVVGGNDNAEVHYNRGNALRDEQKLEEAVLAYRQAIEVRPGLVEAYNNLANVLSSLRRFDEAIAVYLKVIEIRPNFAKAHNNLGGVLREVGRLDEALAALDRAIHLEPNYALAHSNRGVVLQQLRRAEEAIASFGTAIRLAPRSAENFYLLGNALNDQSRAADAIASYNRAIELRPGYAEPHCALGNLFQEQGDVDQAGACCQRAISLKPDLAEAHNVLGNILRDQGEQDLAIESYRRATELKPDAATIHSNLAYAIHFHPDYDAPTILAENRRWAERHERPLLALAHRKHQNDRSTDRRLKIGYVSPDFRRHPAACFVLPLLAHHDARQVEVFCYSGVKHPDAVTAQCRQSAHVWRDVAGLSDADLAERIRLDQIDILVDLTLHMSGNRLLTFARKPAPVQVTWLGYPSTTGMSSIDYRLSDPYLDPPGLGDELYSEKTIRLAHTFWCYQPPITTPDVNSLPALQSGHVTFACLNHFGKVTAPTLELWSQTLNAVAQSRLIILSPIGAHRDRVRQVFQRAGISPERIEFVTRLAPEEYFRLFHRIDLCLDPIPYPGHTSMLDSLWMGTPAITLAGQTAAARGGASILSNLNLPQFIAATPDEYVAIARATMGNLASLAELRAHLRQKMRASPLMDANLFARDIESVYREIWASGRK